MMNSVKKRAVMNYDLMNKEIRGRTGKTLLAKYFDKIWPCSQKFKGSFSSILENTPRRSNSFLLQIPGLQLHLDS